MIIEQNWQLPAFVVTPKPLPGEVVIVVILPLVSAPGNKGAFVLSDK